MTSVELEIGETKLKPILARPHLSAPSIGLAIVLIFVALNMLLLV